MVQRKETKTGLDRKSRSVGAAARLYTAAGKQQVQAAQGKKKRKHNQKFLDERKREQVDQDVVQILQEHGQDETSGAQQANPFAYPTSNTSEQRKTAKKMDQTLEAFDLLMKQM